MKITLISGSFSTQLQWEIVWFTDRFRSMSECKNNYYITVVEDISKNMIVACATLVIEQKFIHSCGVVSKLFDGFF